MVSTAGSRTLVASVAVDPVGMPLGRIKKVTADGAWALIDVGLIFHRSAVIPLGACRAAGGDVLVPWRASTVWSAPKVRWRSDGQLDPSGAAVLLDHYGL